MPEYAEFLKKLAAEAGAIMRKHHHPGGVAFDLKADKTRVTAADREIGEMVAKEVATAYPEAVLIREEADFPARTGHGLEFVVDELDGTKQYSEGGREAVFAAAVMDSGVMRDAIIHAPLLASPLEYTASLSGGAFCGRIRLHAVGTVTEPLRVAVATAGHPAERYDAQPIIARLEQAGCVVEDVKSISWSCALLVENQIDGVLFPFGTLWDIAPGDLLVREAGGVTSDLNGRLLDYSGNSVDGFIMANSRAMHKMLFDFVRNRRREPT